MEDVNDTRTSPHLGCVSDVQCPDYVRTVHAQVVDALSRFSEELQLDYSTVQFSAQTSSGRTQEMIEMKLDKRRTVPCFPSFSFGLDFLICQCFCHHVQWNPAYFVCLVKNTCVPIVG